MDRKTVDLYRSKDPIVSLFMFCRIIHGYLPNIFFCELYKCDGIIITAPLTSWKGSLLQRHTPVPPLWYRVSWPLFPSSQLHHIDDCFTMTIVHSQRVVKFYNIGLWNLAIWDQSLIGPIDPRSIMTLIPPVLLDITAKCYFGIAGLSISTYSITLIGFL